MIKTFLCVALLVIGWQRAWSFSLEGPSLGPDAYQTEDLGYNLGGYDVGAPKNIGQGYRRNVPIIYYGYDQAFLTFFGSNGTAAVDSAFAVMNTLTNADSIQVSQFPFHSQENYGASADLLSDVKSFTMGEIMQQIGLSEPVRYVWTLHDRFLPAGATCSTNPAANGEEYLVVQRNFDPISQNYSSYVNGTLYDYLLFESCGNVNQFPDDVVAGLTIDSLAAPFPVDVAKNSIDGTYTPVAETLDPWVAFEDIRGGDSYGSLANGGFYTGLTYDDVGGFRYLYSTNNVNVEAPGPGAQLEQTNFNTQTILETMNLADLLEFSSTNPPAAVQARFPGITINSFSTYQTLVKTYNTVVTLVPLYGAPAGSAEQVVVSTNGFTLTTQTNFAYVFGNIVIVDENSNSVAQIQTVQGYMPAGAVVGSNPLTNTTYQTVILSNVVSGDFYIIPPGTCGPNIISVAASNYLAAVTTNVIASGTNSAGFVGSESIITFFTNNFFYVNPCALQAAPPTELYQGIGHIQFIRADYDSDTGQFFQPITTNYTMVMVTNSQAVVQRFTRTITQPDILIDAVDLASPNVAQIGTGFPPFSRTVAYTEDPLVPGAAAQSGPGTITDYPTTISYNSAGNVIGLVGSVVNGAAFLGAESSLFTWGSFDSTTNAPIVYPNTQSLQNQQNQILIQITPAPPLNATNNTSYSQTFTTTGGSFTPPYTWSLGVDPIKLTQTTLPNGLTLSSGGMISGTSSAADGTYDFVLVMTDLNGRSVSWNYTINISQ